MTRLVINDKYFLIEVVEKETVTILAIKMVRPSLNN